MATFRPCWISRPSWQLCSISPERRASRGYPCCAELESIQSRIEAACGDLSAERLLGQTPTPGDSYQAELLLKTPLLNSATRRDLLAAADQRNRQLASNYDLASVSIDDVKTMEPVGTSPGPSIEDWQFLVQQAQLESRYIGLSRVAGTDPEAFSAVITAHEVDVALQALENAYLAVKSETLPSSSGSSATLALAVETLWLNHAQFGMALQAFYRSAAEIQGALSPCGVSPTASRAAVRLLRMLDARDAWQLESVDVNSLSLATRITSTILWQANRLEQASTYRTGKASELYASWAEEYRTQSELICRSSGSSGDLASIKLSSPVTADLQYRESDEVVVQVQNPNDREVSITISLNYEHQLIDVAPLPPVDHRDPSAAQDPSRPEFIDSPSQFGTRRSKPITIAAAGSISLPLKIARRNSTSRKRPNWLLTCSQSSV